MRTAIFVLFLLFGAFLVVVADNVSAEFEGGYTYSVDGGVATITNYSGTDTAITIPSTLGGYPTVAIADLGFWSKHNLTTVNIPSSVNSIGREAFTGCFSLTSINVNASNPSYASVDGVLYNKSGKRLIQCPGGRAGAFAIPSGVVRIDDYAFDGCIRLTSVTIPDSVTAIG